MTWEVVIFATGQRLSLSPGREYYVGSSTTAHVRLTASDVSHSHALICVSPDQLRIVDLGSRNGTYLNGKRITSAIARSGDTIAFSSVKAQVLLVDTPPPPPPERPSVEKVTSHTAELPVVNAEEALIELIRAWDTAPENAVNAFLCWLGTRRRLEGCALMASAQGMPVVLAGQGELPPAIMGDPSMPTRLVQALGAKDPWQVHHLVAGEVPFLLISLGEELGLLLFPGPGTPTTQELELMGRLARLALRLSRTGV